MFDWLKRSIAKRAVKGTLAKRLQTAEDSLQRAEHELRAAAYDTGHRGAPQLTARQAAALRQRQAQQPECRSLASRASTTALQAAQGAKQLVAPIASSDHSLVPGLRPGDRPVLLLVAVLLLMLGQWVVVAALLTVEALSTIAGIALLAIALQGSLVQGWRWVWQHAKMAATMLQDAGQAVLQLPSMRESMDKMANEVADMNSMLHILKAKTKWLPGQPTMQVEDAREYKLPQSSSHGDIRSPFYQ